MRLVITIWIVVSGCLLADEDSGMVQADRAFVQAVAKADKAALEKVLDPEFTWIDAEGRTRLRAQVVQGPPKSAIADENGAELKRYSYGDLGNVQANFGKAHVLRVWVKRPDGWKAIVYQEVVSLDVSPAFAPSSGKDCENPCKRIPFKPKNEIERQVAAAYSKLETAAMAHNSAVFATMVGEEFVAASSNSNKIYSKRERMDDFDHSKNGGVAPTPFTTGRMLDFGNAVLMISEHTPARGKPLHVTRVWVKQDGNWVETVSYQTSVK